MKRVQREWLHATVHEGDDVAAAKQKALAEHVARHPEDASRTCRADENVPCS